MHHNLVISLQDLANSKILWISGHRLYAHYAGDNPTGYSGSIGKVNHIKGNDVTIKCHKHDAEYIKQALEPTVPL